MAGFDFSNPDLSNLFGLSLSPQPLDSQAPSNGISPPVAAQTANAPLPMQNALLGQSPQSNANGPDGTPDDITINGWRPHKTSTLGHIADTALALMGIPSAPFSSATARQNTREAMEGFTQDPIGTIQKMAKIPGMEQKAFQLYEQYTQIHGGDAERDTRTQYIKDRMADSARGTIASYMGAVNSAKDPNAVYQKMLPTLRQYAQARGLDTSILPDQYDPDIAKSVMIGGIKPEDQVRLSQQQQYQQSELGLRQQSVDSENSYRNSRLGQINQELGEHVRHDQTIEGIEKSRVGAGPTAPRGLKPVLGLPDPVVGARKVVQLKGADGAPITNGPSNVLYQFEKDGRWHAYQKNNGQIQQLGTLSRAKDGRWYQD